MWVRASSFTPASAARRAAPAAVEWRVSLARAAKVQRRAAGWGFTWRSVEQALAKLDEEVAELGEAASDPARAEEELGDVLLAAVGVSRLLGLDAESALRRATTRFASRAEGTLALATERGLDPAALPDDELIALYDEAKEAGP